LYILYVFIYFLQKIDSHNFLQKIEMNFIKILYNNPKPK